MRKYCRVSHRAVALGQAVVLAAFGEVGLKLIEI